jgi:5-formyltetrahydrofolate cyclo-ligase
MIKAELRKRYLQKRKNVSASELHQRSFNIYQQFFSYVDLSFIKIVHTFIPIAKNGEPDTWLIIDRIRREFPHIRLSVPKIDTATHSMENFFFEGLHQLEENKMGIKQPKQGVPTESQKIDLVLVPLLIFDEQGNRVGYGKGYYDKFLATCRADCQKIGISIFPPVQSIQDTNDHDFKLTACVTPEKIYQF